MYILVDAHVIQVSAENRFDAALQANGYRTLTSKPGHHMTMLQSLPLTVGLDSDMMIVLDALRKQRNIADYTGDIVPESA